MSTLEKPKFKNLDSSSVGGAPALLTLWNYFDLSLLMTQCGIFKNKGIATWKLAFLYVIGLLSKCSSCVQMLNLYQGDSLLQKMFGQVTITQSVFSRLMTTPYNWNLFNQSRVNQLQNEQHTQLEDDDILALDDTLVEHNHAKKIPFIYRLFNHCSDTFVKAMNLIVLYVDKENGVQYPLFYSIWKKADGKSEHQTRLDLALDMLRQLKKQIGTLPKCWLVMDNGYCPKDFIAEVEKLGLHYVTRVKSSATLYRKIKVRGKE